MTSFWVRNSKSGATYEILVDLEDLPNIISQGSWSVTEYGYVRNQRWIDGKNRKTFLHRFVMGAKPGDPEVDHKDGNKLNNCKSNLRYATKPQQNQNLNNVNAGSSRYRGVTWDKTHDIWRAAQRIDRKLINIGSFQTEEEAHDALVQFRLERGLEPGFEQEPRHRKTVDRSTWAKPTLPVENNRGTSKYRGVSYSSRQKKYQAQVTVNGKRNHLGWFDNEENAYQVVLAFRETQG